MNRAKKINLLTSTYTSDSIGNITPIESKKAVFAYVRSASQSEFFNAGEAGFKPDKVFDVLLTEYDGQSGVEFGSDVYTIYRTYDRDDGRVELYAEKRVGS